ncbi:MAG: ferritin-like domain-containing protein [Mycolicibacterium sp.]|uniref:ferritin-like domain-containing protein n=1 Tax=Mycolicibacterium sp. TaxID=2320850 RepID=UPI003D100DA4
MTSPNPPLPTRPSDAAEGALFDAIATEHATIYGYGIVSAHSLPEVNYLVSEAISQHRARREAAIAMLDDGGVEAPLPAAGYSLPIDVDTPAAAANLAVTMEQDSATAWRAVVEQATDQSQRAFAVAALTESAVMAARWRQIRGDTTITVAFPGGSE